MFVQKTGNANSGSWKNKMPRFAWVPKGGGALEFPLVLSPLDKQKMQEENDIKDAFSKISNEFAKTITPEQRTAIRSYSSNGYAPINNFMRNGDVLVNAGVVPGDAADVKAWGLDPDSIKRYEDMSRQIAGAFKPLPVDMVVWRGMLHSHGLQKGTMVDKGFVSTTFSPFIARGFTRLQDSHDKTMIRMLLPKGTPVIIPKSLAEHYDTEILHEYEVILPPNTEFKMISEPEVSADTTYGRADVWDVSVKTQKPHPVEKGGAGSGAPFGNQNARKLDIATSTDTLTDFQSLYNNFRSTLSDADVTALNEYNGIVYEGLNHLLNKKKLTGGEEDLQPEYHALAVHLNRIMRPLPVDVVAYRGVRHDASVGYKDGDVLKNRGFTSTSVIPDIAKGFTSKYGSVIKINIPAGTRAALLNLDAGHGFEYEVLLAPGTHFRIDNVSKREWTVVPAKTKVTVKSLIAKGGKGSGAPIGNKNAWKGGPKKKELIGDDRIFKKFDQVADAYAKTLTPNQHEAVEDYTVVYYKAINNYMRNGDVTKGTDVGLYYTKDTDKHNANAKAISDTLISAFKPLPVSMVVWRGVRDTRGLEAGQFSDKGFVSTSVNKTVAHVFSDRGSTGDIRRTLIRMTLPKGTPVIIAGNDFRGEREVILPPSSTFTVVHKGEEYDPDYKEQQIIYDVKVRTKK